MSLCWLCSFPHRDVPIGAKNIPHRVRFTRALLESKDLSMRFSLPLCVWVSGISPCSLETASEKRSPRTSYPPGWEAEFAGGGISKLPSARRDSQPACVWKPISARSCFCIWSFFLAISVYYLSGSGSLLQGFFSQVEIMLGYFFDGLQF